METLDKTDLEILRTLQENARLTTKELASRVSLSPTPVFERLKRLEKAKKDKPRHSGRIYANDTNDSRSNRVLQRIGQL